MPGSTEMLPLIVGQPGSENAVIVADVEPAANDDGQKSVTDAEIVEEETAQKV